MDAKLDVGEILRETTVVLSSSAGAAAIYVVVLGAIGSAIDLYGASTNIVSTVTTVVGGFLLLRAMLLKSGLLEPGPAARFGAYFGLSLLSGLGILLGFIVLVVPGIVLIVRWLPAYAILLSEDTRVTEALSQSWDRTRSQFWPVLAAVLLVLVLGLVAAVIYAASDITSAVPLKAAMIAGNLALSLISAVFTALGVAVYRLLGARSDTLGEVFA
jgi:hypothetical protein